MEKIEIKADCQLIEQGKMAGFRQDIFTMSDENQKEVATISMSINGAALYISTKFPHPVPGPINNQTWVILVKDLAESAYKAIMAAQEKSQGEFSEAAQEAFKTVENIH